MSASDLDRAIAQHHQALDAFMRGDPEPMLSLYSRRDDVTIANPFGPPARGWSEASATMKRAAAHYADGDATGFDSVSQYATEDLAYTVEIERLRSKVGGADEITPLDLRVTTVFRREGNEWKIVHRHADAITSPRAAESVVQR